MSTYFWTVVGSVAGVAAVALGAIEIWRRREPPEDARAAIRDRPENYPDSAFPPFGHRPVHLRGRRGLLAEFTENFAARDGKVHVLCGLGGVGKTAVAIELAAQARAASRQVWWITVKDSDSLLRTALGILASLKASAEEIHRVGQGFENPADLFWRYMENQQGWLLVFDQADDPGILALGGNPISDGRGWVRSSRSGVVLVTSRHSDAAAWGSDVVIHQLQSLNDNDGAAVLLDLAPHAGKRAEAEQLSRVFAGLPLALHLAGRHLSSPETDETTFAAYEGALSRSFTTLMGGFDEPDEARMRELVTFTWELSLRALNSRGMPEARKMLRLLSCFATGVGVPRALLDLPVAGKMLGRRAHAPREVLRVLRSVGLIDYDSVGNGHPVKVVLVHPLVANITRDQMSRFRRIIGSYGLSDYDMTLAPAVAVRLVNEALADLRRRGGGQRSIIVVRSFSDRSPMLSIGPDDDSDPVDSRHTATLAMLDDLAASPAGRQLLAVHVYELLQYESRDLSDRDLANLIRAAAVCLLDLLDFGFSADATEMMELIFEGLSRWGPDPMHAAANMNLRHHPPDIPYGRTISRLV